MIISRAEDRCRHYMIDQTPSGKYVIIGEQRVHRTLNDMIAYYRKVRGIRDGLLGPLMHMLI